MDLCTRIPLRRRRRRGWAASAAAWLGIVGICLNALLPIRLAVGLADDLARAGACGHYDADIAQPDPAWRFLALLTGQDATADPLKAHKGLHPPGGIICGFVATPGAFAAPVAATLLRPTHRARLRLSLAAIADPLSVAASAYHSRAPPAGWPQSS